MERWRAMKLGRHGPIVHLVGPKGKSRCGIGIEAQWIETRAPLPVCRKCELWQDMEQPEPFGRDPCAYFPKKKVEFPVRFSEAISHDPSFVTRDDLRDYLMDARLLDTVIVVDAAGVKWRLRLEAKLTGASDLVG